MRFNWTIFCSYCSSNNNGLPVCLVGCWLPQFFRHDQYHYYYYGHQHHDGGGGGDGDDCEYITCRSI
ncbi:hypothetical protein DERF_001246 [Dermatophagoides farinae]|uniref:Uncharacterized protein n=1 Tax=Dermatophagoides farinae TaxID=6954 RepID=A0A922LCX3_DERFA|nr:hypothetical protein DERF_001246 [Dermatophagoides farinae]